MPYPTTRKARWLLRRQKHLRRMRRHHKGRRRTYNFGTLLTDNPVDATWLQLPRLQPLDLARATYLSQPGTPPRGNPAWYVLSGGGRGDPLHVKMVAAFYVNRVLIDWHFRRSWANVHLRCPLRWGLKIGRMTGRQRQEWGAEHFARRNGFFPDWDVLGRHPNETDVANGASELPQTTEPFWTDYEPYNTSA